MGDRGNIIVSSQEDGGELHFYTHWYGSCLPSIVACGLERGRPRWDDYQYLNRILFCEMIRVSDDGSGNALLEETGFGISRQIRDGGVEVFIDHDDRTVYYNGETLTFSEFIERYSE